MKAIALGFAAAAVLNVAAAAQMSDSFERWDTAVVRLKCDAGREGSGVIVDTSLEGVVVVTARHVLEDSQPPSPCEVTFKGEPRAFRAVWLDADVKAPDVDLAVLRVPRSAGLPAADRIQPFRQADPEDIWVRAPVFTVGHPLGLPWAWNETTIASEENKITRAVARGTADAGSSGGAVLTPSGGLVGLATTVGDVLLDLTSVADIRDRLELIKINATLLTAEVAPSNFPLKFPPIATGRPELAGPREQAATRDVLRRYYLAMRGRDLEALLRIRTDLRRPSLSALFADAVDIAMPMSCEPLVRSTLTRTCAYSLTIARRTGSEFKADGLKQIFTFEESTSDETWRIIKADVLK